MILIVAADENFGIGRGNDLLTFLPEDLEFFKQNTVNKTIVIGRKTLESFKNGKPLPKRHHIVLSRSQTYDHERITTVASIDELLEAVKQFDPSDVFVSGGGTVYEALLPYCSKAYVTMIDADLSPDTYMPNLEEHPDWTCVETGDDLSEGELTYRHTTWVNKTL